MTTIDWSKYPEWRRRHSEVDEEDEIVDEFLRLMRALNLGTATHDDARSAARWLGWLREHADLIPPGLCDSCEEMPADDTFENGGSVCVNCWDVFMSIPWEDRYAECLRCGTTPMSADFGWAYEVSWVADWDGRGHGEFMCDECWQRD